jgi:hypothetical protein
MPSGRVDRQRGEGDSAGTSPRLGSTLLEEEGEGKWYDFNAGGLTAEVNDARAIPV